MKSTKLLHNEEESLEAFVAMGGDPSGEGFVEITTLINVLKNDFEIDIDFQKQMEIIDPYSTGKIGYDDFRILLFSGSGLLN